MATGNIVKQSSYQYGPLQSNRGIRLLSLKPPDNRDDPVELSIHHFSLDDAPEYIALSYTWGSPVRNVLVTAESLPIKITPCLREALQHMRELQRRKSTLRGLWWWIDMICINQEDPHELGSQVAFMRDIFHGAQLVVAWIGPASTGSHKLLSEMVTRADHHQDESASATETLLQPESCDSDELGAPRRHNLLHEVRDFLTRPFWTRVWIIQEICVCRDVLISCGDQTIPWDLFAAELGSVKRKSNMKPYGVYGNPFGVLSVPDFAGLTPYNLVDLRDRYEEKKLSLGSLITLTSQCQSTDPRDKVYSLLGLVTDGSETEITPDYTISACQVFCAAIRTIHRNILQSELRSEESNVEIGIRVENILRSCSHRPLWHDWPSRKDCDGDSCGAWWCCLDLALWD